MNWTNVSWAIGKISLTPQQVAILEFLCDRTGPVDCREIGEWLRVKGYAQANRDSVRVQATHMRKKIKDLNFEIASMLGPGGGLFLRLRG